MLHSVSHSTDKTAMDVVGWKKYSKLEPFTTTASSLQSLSKESSETNSRPIYTKARSTGNIGQLIMLEIVDVNKVIFVCFAMCHISFKGLLGPFEVSLYTV